MIHYEYSKIERLISAFLATESNKRGEEIFNLLKLYNLLNPLISNISPVSSHFHTKFYAGVLKHKEGCKVEVLTGSYNIHDGSNYLENIVLREYDIPFFNKRYLEPLGMKEIKKCELHVEVLKIVKNNGEIEGKRNVLYSVEDIW